jgi:hypothetical protein
MDSKEKFEYKNLTFGEKEREVRIEIITKYTFEILLNYRKSEHGAQENIVYR